MMKRRINLILIIALLCITVQTKMAAQVFETTYTVTGGSELIGDESCRKLLDGDIHTKWCEFCGTDELWVEFYSAEPFVPTGYILTTGDDNTLNNYRNPRTWRVYGKEDDDWKELSKVVNDESMDDKNYAPYEFALNNPDHKQYQYFKFVVYDVRSFYFDYFQLSEFQFKGYSSLTNMKDAVVTFSQPVIDYNNGSPAVSYTVKDALGTTIASDQYDASFSPSDVSAEGQYTMTLTGKGGYSGTKTVTFWVKKQLTGSGTEATPYKIDNTDDWNLFAERVRLGDTYKGKFVKLNSDVYVATMAGSSEVCSFQGTFDGGDKTITLNLTATEDACAPFRFLKDAAVKNLNIAGLVESAYSYAASLVAYGYGTCAFTNCGSTAEVRSNRNDGHKDFHGGFIAVYYPNCSLTFTDCIFAGKMTGGSSYAVGGFVGYSFATVYYNHCLYAGTEFSMGDKDSYTFNGNSNYSHFNGAYITTGIDCWYGTKLYDNTNQFSKVEFDYQDTKYCSRAAVDITGFESSYDPTGSVIDIQPEFYYDKQLLKEGTDYELTTTPLPVQEPGGYTMTFTGKGSYAGVEKRTFVVNADMTGEGTAENPYLITDNATWACFAQKLNDGEDFTGKYFKLSDDFDNSSSPITITAGTDQHPFKGIFLGNNRTLHIDLSGSNKYLAPFSFINGATIQDLTVTGTITSTVEGDGTHGGFAGVNNGNSTFKNCSFTGSMLGALTTSCGGFVGWTNGNLTYEDCVFNPQEITISSNNCATFNRNGKNSLKRCYYTTPLGETQGVQVTEDANTVHSSEQIQIGGVNYYRKCDITGLKQGYPYTGEPIAVTPVVKFGSTTLTEGTDYTVVYKNSSNEDVAANQIVSCGSYTVTVTGQGNYAGAYTATFYILESEALANYLFKRGQDEKGVFYMVSTAADWNALGILVANFDNGTSGKRFKLMNDISVTTMIGANDDTRSFQGTFDGDGHTLTVTLSGGADDKDLAPFRYAKGATFCNLTVAGSITSARDGDGTHGGFVGVNNEETFFNNCAFTGSLLGEKTTSCGGFVGWNNGIIHYTDCLFAPAEITMKDKESATFNRNGQHDLVRTYYVTPFGEKQGTQVYTSDVEGIVTRTITAADGKTYYVAMCYSIASEADWNELAQMVLDDEQGYLPVVMLADITVSKSIGTRDHPFRGKFLGNGKTLTVNLSGDGDTRFLAPFSFVENATFRNLTVAGTITSTREGDGTHGGFVGVSSGRTSFEKCIFTGSLLGEKTTKCGGFVGWNNSWLTYTDCLFAPTEITMSSEGSATFNLNYSGTMIRTYFLTPFGEKQGLQAFTSSEAAAAAGVVAAPEEFFNGTTYYVDCGLQTDETIDPAEPGHYYLNMSEESSDYYTIPASVTSLKIYDNGGKDKNASPYCDSELVLTVPEECVIQALGEVELYDDFWDILEIYDGDSFYGHDCLTYRWGTQGTIGPVISSQETMRLYFRCWDDSDKCNINLTLNIVNLKLNDRLDNTSKISAKVGSKVNAALYNRMLYKDGYWNTLCLPFDVTAEQIAAGDLAGAVIKELDTEAGSYEHPTGYENNTLYLNFKDATSIVAGKPYLIKWDQAIRQIKSPVFTGVTVTESNPSVITSSDGYVSFVGTYSPTDIFSADKTNLYVADYNKLNYPWEEGMKNFTINSCRGYFRLNNGLTAGAPDSSTPGLNIVMNFNDDETTGLTSVPGLTPVPSPKGEGSDYWYTLSGTRLNVKPTQKGVYIHRGRKVVIK